MRLTVLLEVASLFIRSFAASADVPQLIAGGQDAALPPWGDAPDLGLRVRRRLEQLAAEELAPWVRVGQTLFRAREITNDGRTIKIDAAVRSDAVHSELVRLRDQRSSAVPFASPNDAQLVQIGALSTRTVSTVGHEAADFGRARPAGVEYASVSQRRLGR